MTKSREFYRAVALVAIGAAITPIGQQLVEQLANSNRSLSLNTELLYSRWLDLSEQRIVAEQFLASEIDGIERYSVRPGGVESDAERSLYAVVSFFERAGALVAAGTVDAPQLAMFMAADLEQWRARFDDLLSRSEGGCGAARYRQIERAIDAIDAITLNRAPIAQQFTIHGEASHRCVDPSSLSDGILHVVEVVNRGPVISPVPSLVLAIRPIGDESRLIRKALIAFSSRMMLSSQEKFRFAVVIDSLDSDHVSITASVSVNNLDIDVIKEEVIVVEDKFEHALPKFDVASKESARNNLDGSNMNPTQFTWSETEAGKEIKIGSLVISLSGSYRRGF